MHVTLPEIQAWLEPTKLTVGSIDVQLEAIATAQVFGQLVDVYDTSVWVDESNTPVLVRKIIAMYIAAWTYMRQYSEDNDLSPYARWLENKANQLLLGLSTGSIDLPEVIPVGTETMTTADYWPNYETLEGPYFAMGQTF